MSVEILDLVDDNDQVIGQEERMLALKNSRKNIRVINIFIYNSKVEIIVPVRSANRRIFPNCYDFSVGGFVTSGDDYEQTAYRELEEEMGITGVKLEEIGYFNPDQLGTACFSKLYKLVYGGPLNYDHDGIAEIQYLTEEEISSRLKSNPEKFKGDYSQLFNWMINQKK